MSAVAALAFLVPSASGQKPGVLETLSWKPCDRGTSMCGDLYFCAADATTWEYWTTEVDPMSATKMTWGDLWPAPKPYTLAEPWLGVDGTTDVTLGFLHPVTNDPDPNGSNRFLYGYRTGSQTSCRPGKAPIMRVQPGVRYKLTFHNTADMDDPIKFPFVWSQLNTLNVSNIMNLDPMNPAHSKYFPTHVTNLHIHGLHQSGQGDFDNVMREVFPGYKLTYTYIIPDNHPGGMHWFHAHFHGKVVFNTFGGAYGAFIVDDTRKLLRNPPLPPGATATALDNNVVNFLMDSVNERVLMAFSGFKLWTGNGIPGGAPIQLIANQWHRVRVMHVFPEGLMKWTQFQDFVGLTNPKTGLPLCEIHELAWDGTYASSVPYVIPLDSGHPFRFAVHGAERTEYAIRCPGTGQFVLRYVAITPGTSKDGLVATFTVVAGLPNTNTPFNRGNQKWAPYRPPWLADLQGTIDQIRSRPLTSMVTVMNDPVELVVSMNGLNDVRFTTPDVPVRGFENMAFGLETVHQVKIFGSGAHPTHMHQQHFQVIGPQSKCGKLKIGEFYDTISNLDPDAPSLAPYEPTDGEYVASQDGCLVRFRNVEFCGPQVIHCHILDHEDIGILGVLNVTCGPGAFEWSSAFTNSAVLVPDCVPRLDRQGDVVCRTNGQCGTASGYDTCNKPCTAAFPKCPGTATCELGVCVPAVLKQALCAAETVSAAVVETQVPGYMWAIVGIAVAVAAISVLGAVLYVRRSAHAMNYAAVEMENREGLPRGWKSPFQGNASPMAACLSPPPSEVA